jgi:hypothetical protein
MGLHLVPFAVGAVLGSAATYLYKDKEARDRVAEESRHFTHAVGGYMHGLLGRFVEAEKVAAPLETETVRCEGLTKAGERCRARATKVVAAEQPGGETAELHLCWRHATAHEKGEGSASTRRKAGAEAAAAYRH